MQVNSKQSIIIASLLIFIVLPLLLFFLGDVPARSVLKDSISILTIVAFSLMLQQFFLTRLFKKTSQSFKLSQISKIHKIIGYIILPIFLLHPVLLVVPRFFEAGVEPLDALITILTTFESLGVVLGLIAWGLMFLLGITAIFRYKLVKKFSINYKAWRIFHGSLTILFMSLASWHAIDLGRHINLSMAVFMIVFVLSGSVLFTWNHVFKSENLSGAK
ncbi:MAG: ferric reductase-like transmembrane domain-containing protein [Arenicellales bacterium]